MVRLFRKRKRKTSLKKQLQALGPGLITGASDDDPSGIASYSQVGAQFGYSTLWMAWLTFPLMSSIQEICARIGIVTQNGITSSIRYHYPKWVLWLIIIFTVPAVLLNIGADVQGMAAVAHLILPQIPIAGYSILFTVVISFFILYSSYDKLSAVLKWICLVLFIYIIVPFMIPLHWGDILKNTFFPHITWNKDYISMMVAILGTTISPYMFFWQATMEAEKQNGKLKHRRNNTAILKDMRKDVDFGMLFSNIVMFFIILTCGSVLYPHGIRNIQTVDQAAKALEPFAGKYAYILFALGIIGTGFLSLPVLTGSISYMLAEAFQWKKGLDKPFKDAKAFYIVMIGSLVAGLGMNFLGISPIQALIYSSILYGLTAPVIILVVLHISNNKAIMKSRTNSRYRNIMGVLTFAFMLTAAIALLYLQFF